MKNEESEVIKVDNKTSNFVHWNAQQGWCGLVNKNIV